eukprot:CAMPEP_0168740288 /NCGR_PEP_ID=MMETSP0724-20121128/11904_1 /TAXON_ID=265536 /ORGANISM="Amphiprora sp., Strain CCMP467" /LENGTH=213 /DNA_ID=CAMNT_0008787723 /DNA_START=521 /DNA_END=1162 /DNA_ORIENTATION=-
MDQQRPKQEQEPNDLIVTVSEQELHRMNLSQLSFDVDDIWSSDEEQDYEDDRCQNSMEDALYECRKGQGSHGQAGIEADIPPRIPVKPQEKLQLQFSLLDAVSRTATTSVPDDQQRILPSCKSYGFVLQQDEDEEDTIALTIGDILNSAIFDDSDDDENEEEQEQAAKKPCPRGNPMRHSALARLETVKGNGSQQDRPPRMARRRASGSTFAT